MPIKVVWRGKIRGHDAELVECDHIEMKKPPEFGSPPMACLLCGETKKADFLPLLTHRWYRPVWN